MLWRASERIVFSTSTDRSVRGLVVGKVRAKLVQEICHWYVRLVTVIRFVPEADMSLISLY